MPNDLYISRTTPLTSKRCILYIYSTNVGTEYFKHAIYSPFFSLQNAVCFIMLTCLVPVLLTFYIQGVLKLKKNNSGSRGLMFNDELWNTLQFADVKRPFITRFICLYTRRIWSSVYVSQNVQPPFFSGRSLPKLTRCVNLSRYSLLYTASVFWFW